MSVTKRVRFEVLRRDEHTCQYCGQMAPDVTLHIDHVIPVALGGSDDPGNLVTACRDCNAGKASISPDSPIVAAVSDRSAEFALAQANVAAHIKADMAAIRDYCDEFEDAWKAWGRGEGDSRTTMPLPADWRRSITAWWRMSVPLELLQESIPTAMTSKGKNQVGIADDDRFRYFAGIVWRALEDYGATYPVGSARGRVYSEDEREDYGVDNFRNGRWSGLLVAKWVVESRDFLRHHIDGTEPRKVSPSLYAEYARTN